MKSKLIKSLVAIVALNAIPLIVLSLGTEGSNPLYLYLMGWALNVAIITCIVISYFIIKYMDK